MHSHYVFLALEVARERAAEADARRLAALAHRPTEGSGTGSDARSPASRWRSPGRPTTRSGRVGDPVTPHVSRLPDDDPTGRR